MLWSHMNNQIVVCAVLASWAAALMAVLGLAAAAPQPIPFKAIDSGLHAGSIENPREVVVRTPAEWKTLCGEYAEGRTCPSVDFARSIVVGVFLGTRRSAGFSVEIARVERDGDAVTVSYRERQPGPDDMVAQMITSPYQLVTIE